MIRRSLSGASLSLHSMNLKVYAYNVCVPMQIFPCEYYIAPNWKNLLICAKHFFFSVRIWVWQRQLLKGKKINLLILYTVPTVAVPPFL